MSTNNLLHDVQVSIKDIHTNTSGLHKHHYFELIYVMSGKGIHNINHNHYNFGSGDVFLLTPEDLHTFQIDEPTKFCIVDFTKAFFAKRVNRVEEKMDVGDLFKRLEYIFHNHQNTGNSIVAKNDQPLFKILMSQLIRESNRPQVFGELITQNIIFLLLNLIARNIQENASNFLRNQNPKTKIHEITAYIQHHVYDKELLKIENIATSFNKSPDYLNRYFKNETGETIKEYITKYKLNLIKTRLKFSDMTISEMADEMNFTDESHLNKTFKSVFGMTAKQFKKHNYNHNT